MITLNVSNFPFVRATATLINGQKLWHQKGSIRIPVLIITIVITVDVRLICSLLIVVCGACTITINVFTHNFQALASEHATLECVAIRVGLV